MFETILFVPEVKGNPHATFSIPLWGKHVRGIKTTSNQKFPHFSEHQIADQLTADSELTLMGVLNKESGHLNFPFS
jgi:aminoglycoside N3'-acetyltransferase